MPFQITHQEDKSVLMSTAIKQNTVFPDLENHLKQLSKKKDDNDIDKVIALFKKKIAVMEQKIWQDNGPDNNNVTEYQQAFKALEQLHSLKSVDNRFNFKIIIPVADRPQHLKQCLNSLLTLCQTYGYGGFNEQYTKVSVLIADDSKQQSSIDCHQQYCTEFTEKGLHTEYFGHNEQLLLTTNASSINKNVQRTTSTPNNIENSGDFTHKGASIMRNITYLKLKQSNIGSNTLLYFIDSDQEFCINSTNSTPFNKTFFAINYFHYLNEIFTSQKVDVLTGKVVGDPPVSPSVMAGNFQKDIQRFINTINKLEPENNCYFHKKQKHLKDDAAYHDMANLFGFNAQETSSDYLCTLHKQHKNIDCFYDFSRKLEHFFFGEHPTRKTYFNYENSFMDTAHARTVYTGNYIIKPAMLYYFIPFATLKLRMAGPVLGRILKTRIQHKFVSANLPMLHNRTIESTGQSEFRTGVTSKNNRQIDLGNEFIRQFYGDVMLFSIEKLSAIGYPEKSLSTQMIKNTVQQTYTDIKNNYIQKHNTILTLQKQLTRLIDNKEYWWNNADNKSAKTDIALTNFHSFLDNIKLNFDAATHAYQQIISADGSSSHLTEIQHAIEYYPDDINTWKQVMDSF